ncbi:hypothetical protein GmHk_13G039100 [Glycine max]|nr:hypothetical protein GmHk_13G039100 [Glycine max]
MQHFSLFQLHILGSSFEHSPVPVWKLEEQPIHLCFGQDEMSSHSLLLLPLLPVAQKSSSTWTIAFSAQPSEAIVLTASEIRSSTLSSFFVAQFNSSDNSASLRSDTSYFFSELTTAACSYNSISLLLSSIKALSFILSSSFSFASIIAVS